MKRITRHNPRASQSGYALVLVIFFLALLVISMAAAAPTVLSSIQREKEKEMVWRGKQYTRGIRMYYMKMHRFPTALDDLTEPKTGLRFMRKAYKDPMNKVDGTWRLIYVGPNGQLIGSLTNRTFGMGGMAMGAGMAGAQGANGSLFSNGQSSPGGASAFGSSNSSFGSSGFGSRPSAFNSQQGGAMTTASADGANGDTANANNNGDSDDMSQPHSLSDNMDASNTIGGNIIGVGSKINKRSFMVYEKAKNYRMFEFIWDPSQDVTVGRASVGIGTPVQNINGANPAGANPMNPNQNQFNQSPNPAQGGNPGSLDPSQSPPLQAPPQ